MKITTYLELRSVVNEETGELTVQSAWLVIKQDKTNELILSQDMSNNQELINAISKGNFGGPPTN